MKFVILLSIFGAVFGAPSNYGGYESFPSTTLPSYSPPVAHYTAPPVAPTYTKTYFHPMSAPSYKFYSAHPVTSVTGNLYNFLDTHGQYKFGYSQSDGQSKSETKQIDGGVTGQYSYLDPEGNRVELSYVADKDGFRAVGDHLPIAPRVPDLPADLAQAYNEAYQRLYKAHEEARLRGEPAYDDGSYKPEAPSAPVLYQSYVAAPVYQAPVYQAPAPVHTYSTYTAPVAPAPVHTYSTYTAPAVPVAPVHSYSTYTAPAAPVHKPVYSSTSYTAHIGGVAPAPVHYAPAPAAPVHSYSTYSAPAVPVAPVHKPAYSSTSYNTNIGGAPPAPYAPATTPYVPSTTYPPQPKSGYVGNSY